jgi:alpha-tubulin suppressor-like RCC1 family protein
VGDRHHVIAGAGSQPFVLPPTRVRNITDAVAVATGDAFACALHESGHVSCWGDDRRAQLGIPADDEYQNVPTRLELP